MRAQLTTILMLLSSLTACGSDGESNGNGGGGGSGNQNSGGSSGKMPSNVGGQMHSGPTFAGAACPDDIGLSEVFALPNLKGAVDGSNVRITFDPQNDARDYRVYAAPSAGQITGDNVQDGTYRCAGTSPIPVPAVDESDTPSSAAIRTRVESMVKGQARTMADATLGYVFTTPADDRIPVYALGDSNLKADNATCYYMRWPESRVKTYTTSEEERTQLLTQAFRDDGIAFYVPKPGAEGTEPIYVAREQPDGFQSTFYVKGGPEHDKRTGDGLEVSEVFSVYSEAQDGSEPLMRVFYEQVCGRHHDELVAGPARFNKAWQQGSQPVAELHYSGLKEKTTLIVEALDDLCPFQGNLSMISYPARDVQFGEFLIEYPAFTTPDEMRATSDFNELFIAGQGDGTAPRAVSRACVEVTPEPAPEMDFFYDGEPETFSEGVSTGYQTWELESPTFNVQFHTVSTDGWAIGNLLGELRVTYADEAADTNGKFRMTPKQRATLSADGFLHATMTVDAVSSQRRYPQLIISSGEWPVQQNLVTSQTVIVQLFGGVTEPLEVQLEYCDNRNWDVNDQCPKYRLYTLDGPDGEFLSPAPEINGMIGMDRTVRFDAYVSTDRVYLYTNGMPYACADLPAGKLPAGPATVTYADVLYHSGVDLEAWYPFQIERWQVLTTRHFSNLGFSSGVTAPGWDDARMPCAAAPE
jgi:hypothetical protein